MRSIRLAIGMAMIVSGMALGLYVTVHYFGEGIALIRGGQLQQGLIVLLIWSELLGILATLALVIPGVVMLRNLDQYASEKSPPPGPGMLTRT